MSNHAVIIAGGGPTGLMLAGELALAGVDVAILERRPNQDLVGARAGGLHARSLEVLDQRGVVDRFLAAGKTAQVAGYAFVRLDISDFPSRHPYGLALFQNEIERILAGWVQELGVPILYNREVTGFTQDETGVTVTLANGEPVRAEYLVACDGGRSVIRKAAGIDFPGWDPSTSNLIAEVELAEEPAWGMRRDALGNHGFSRLESGMIRVMITEAHPGASGEPTLHDLSEAIRRVYGTDYGVHSPATISRFTDMTRQAAAYRDRRVLLAGDAAHIHYPTGGQGLNTGLQDAVNLGWKLAQVIRGTSPNYLLDTYENERHPVAARVLRNTMAQTALLRPDARSEAAQAAVADLLGLDEPRKRIGGMISGLDIHYDLGEGHPLLGRRMPDLDLTTATGPRRVSTLLHTVRPALLSFGEPGSLDHTPWADRVPLVEARTDGPWALPVLGPVAAPAAVLIRPDGHVAWVGDGTDRGLREALSTWFGAP